MRWVETITRMLIDLSQLVKTVRAMTWSNPPRFGRMDEVKAARELVLCCWLPDGYDSNQ